MANANGSKELPPGDDETDRGFVAIAEDVENSYEVFFSDTETEILECHDRLEDLRLQRAILEAPASKRKDPFADLSDDEVQRRLKDAQTAFLDARAGHQLWNCIVADVVQADPLLKAVHTGPNAGPMERALHPLVDQRDILSLASANLAAGVSATANALTAARTQNMVAMRQNRELAARVLALAAKTKTGGAESIEDLEVRVRLQELKDETRASRRQYRIIKSVVGAVVAASGVDWAEDEELRELVLDDEEL